MVSEQETADALYDFLKVVRGLVQLEASALNIVEMRKKEAVLKEQVDAMTKHRDQLKTEVDVFINERDEYTRDAKAALEDAKVQSQGTLEAAAARAKEIHEQTTADANAILAKAAVSAAEAKAEVAAASTRLKDIQAETNRAVAALEQARAALAQLKSKL